MPDHLRSEQMKYVIKKLFPNHNLITFHLQYNQVNSANFLLDLANLPSGLNQDSFHWVSLFKKKLDHFGVVGCCYQRSQIV